MDLKYVPVLCVRILALRALSPPPLPSPLLQSERISLFGCGPRALARRIVTQATP